MQKDQTNDPVKEIKKHIPALTLKLVAVLVLLGLALATFSFIADEIVLEKEQGFDLAVLNFLAQYNTEGLRQVMKVFTFLGSSDFLLPAYILLIGWLFFQRKTVYALNTAIMAMSSFGLVKGLKLVFQRTRPDDPYITKINNYSFPSGHSVSSIIFFSIMVYIVWKTDLSKNMEMDPLGSAWFYCPDGWAQPDIARCTLPQ